MILFRVVVLALVSGGLASCGPKLKDMPVANFATYQVEPKTEVANATIKGTYTEGGGILLKASRGTYVAAADGKVGFKRDRLTGSVPLTPGVHSLSLGYWIGDHDGFVPARLDAKPGASYVIMEEDGEFTLNFTDGKISNFLSIVEEKTGEVVVPKTPDLAGDATQTYAEPAGTDTATMRGSVEKGAFVLDAAYVVAIDGFYVPVKRGTFFTTGDPYYETPRRLSPGRHALAIYVTSEDTFGIYPIMFDVTPGAVYVVRFEIGLKRNGDKKWKTFTIWIEDEKTGSIAWPKSDFPMKKQLY